MELKQKNHPKQLRSKRKPKQQRMRTRLRHEQTSLQKNLIKNQKKKTKTQRNI